MTNPPSWSLLSVAKSFSADIEAFGKKMNLNADEALRSVALELFGRIVEQSPVDKGRYRASHRVSVNTVDASVEPEGQDTYGLPSSAEISNAKFGDTVILSNNLPYAQRIEDGWSGQAPAGVYGPAFDAVSSIIGIVLRGNN